MTPLVIYHSHCADGFAAAWVCRRALVNAEFFAAAYPEPSPDALPDVAGRDVYVVDYSFGPAALTTLAERAARVVVLDHHEKAVKALKGFSHHKVDLHLDMTKSGGRLCWEFFFASRPLHWLVAYTEDRDLWKWDLPDSKAVSAAIASYPFDFFTWDGWSLAGPSVLPSLVAEGSGILRYQQTLFDRIIASAIEVTIAGYRVRAANTQVLISEIAGHLAIDRPFGACWYVGDDCLEHWSLRSLGQLNVNEIANRYGGGGHPPAAGFTRAPSLDREF